jgi:hypothetical protein
MDQEPKPSSPLRLVRKHLLWVIQVTYWVVKLANGVINYLARSVPQPLRA